MSKSSKQTTQKNSTQTTTMPSYVEAAQKDLLGSGQALLDPRINAGTSGQYVAQFNDDQLTAAQGVRDMYQQGLAQGGLPTSEIERYRNPYTQDVVNTTTATLEDENARRLNEIHARSAAGSAFGGSGSRAALMETEQNRNFGNTLAATTAQLNAAGYDKAVQTAQAAQGYRQQNLQAMTGIGSAAQARRRLVALRGSTGQNNTDRAAMDQIIRHFDDHVEDGLAGGLFSGSERALDLYRQARSEFAQYQLTFRPQGAGDDVGRAMQQIVDRNAQPQEVANLLWGTGVAGNTGRAMRLADRLRDVLPAQHWQSVQQGYLGRVIGDGLEHGKIVDNIQKALSGEGRGLTYKLLEDGQVAGLRSIQSGLRTAAAVREGVPDWVKTLGKSDFEPRAVIDNLFGKSTVTGNTASVQFAKGIRDVVGPQSETWNAVRQAGWQQLVMKPAGATADHGPQAVANRIATFLEKDGRGLANVLYSAEERATMKSFANVMRTLTPKRVAGGSASPNSDTAPMVMKALDTLEKHQGKINMLLSGIGFAHGGPAGAAAAYGISKAAGVVGGRMAERQAVRGAQEAIVGAPTVAPPRRALPARPSPTRNLPVGFEHPLARLIAGF